MKLHRLTMTAFGPFAGTDTVDFDALGADGLFLLHGQTGAGKTTVLDAVAFALFGRVPGARGETRRLRSDHAGPGAHPEVALEFSVQGQRIRIVRSPEYHRAKKRGAGSTVQQAKVSLTWCDRDGSDGLVRIDEVARTVERLLGMTAEQFFQVVLLPQGEFARFLRADTDEREKLLERLFDTRRFGNVEQWFRDQRQLAGQALRAKEEALGRLVARFAQAAGVEEPGDPDPAWADDVMATLRTARQVAERLAADRDEAVRAAEAALATARARAELVQRRRRVDAEFALVEAGRAQRDTDAAACDLARRAAPVMALAEVARRSAQTARTAKQAADARAAAVPLAHLGPVAVRAATTESRVELARLTELADEIAQQARDSDLVEATAVQLAQVEQELVEVATARAGLPPRIDAVAQALASARDAESALPGLQATRESIVDSRDALDEMERVEEGLVAFRAEEVAAREDHLVARQAWLDAREVRLAGMAAELAAALRDGEPCAVCGSVDHPVPATSATRVSAEDEQRAQDADVAAAERLSNVRAAISQCEQRRAALRSRVGDWTRETVSAEVLRIEAELVGVGERAAQAPALDAARSELEAEASRVVHAEQSARERRAELSERIRSLHAGMESRGARLAEVVAEGGDLAARQAVLEQAIAAAESYLDAVDSACQAETDAAAREADAARAAATAGFATVSDACGAALSPIALESLAESVRAFDDRAAAVAAAASAADLVGVSPDETVDLDGPAAAVAAAAQMAREGHAARADALRRSVESEQLRVELDALWDALAPVHAKYAELAALTDVVNGLGQNAQRISLRSYVLAARLDEVAVSANLRLARMSSGRYSFVRTDASGPRGTRGGLGLDVVDDHCGVSRPAKTLSGGESFLASLALALGLADVVAAESGGVLLDTLFIDEGFGTLDADTLDLVMDTLDELRAGGRVVGVVSHVEELRQRIPSRLFVKRTRQGSSLHIEASVPVDASPIAIAAIA